LSSGVGQVERLLDGFTLIQRSNGLGDFSGSFNHRESLKHRNDEKKQGQAKKHHLGRFGVICVE